MNGCVPGQETASIGALAGMAADCRIEGWRPRGRIGVVGFNGLTITGVPPVALSTERTPRQQRGTTGARLVMARIHGVSPEPVVGLPVQIEGGATTRLQRVGGAGADHLG